MALCTTGTPFIGYLSLTNATPGPVSFPIQVVMGGTSDPYTLLPADKVYITNITMSSNDATAALVTVDTGSSGGGVDTTPTKLVSAYLSATQYLQPEQIPPGVCHGPPGVAPRATASAVTAGKTVEIIIKGYIGKT